MKEAIAIMSLAALGIQIYILMEIHNQIISVQKLIVLTNKIITTLQ